MGRRHIAVSRREGGTQRVLRSKTGQENGSKRLRAREKTNSRRMTPKETEIRGSGVSSGSAVGDP